MLPIRHGHRLTRRSALKVVLSSEFPRSASARVAECRALMVRCSAVSATPAGVLDRTRQPGVLAFVAQVGEHPWPSSVHSVSASSSPSWARAQVVSCSRPGRTGEVHSGQPSGAVTTWMFAP